jgi:hypothetical protein
MRATIYCLVDVGGVVHASDGAQSYAEVAAHCGLSEDACQKYRFELTSRRLLVDRGDPAGQRAVRTHLDQRVGTPDRLMQFAADGHLGKAALLDLVTTDQRQAYLDACAAIEKKFTNDCAAANDPCLEAGCSVEGEICLQPLLRAGAEYHKACAAQWIKIFANPSVRIDVWKN